MGEGGVFAHAPRMGVNPPSLQALAAACRRAKVGKNYVPMTPLIGAPWGSVYQLTPDGAALERVTTWVPRLRARCQHPHPLPSSAAPARQPRPPAAAVSRCNHASSSRVDQPLARAQDDEHPGAQGGGGQQGQQQPV